MTKYIIELTSARQKRPLYLKAQQAKRIITTRHESNARKFTELNAALDFVIDNSWYYGYTMKVKATNEHATQEKQALSTYVQCDECGVSFNLASPYDANEWSIGHDCEVA